MVVAGPWDSVHAAELERGGERIADEARVGLRREEPAELVSGHHASPELGEGVFGAGDHQHGDELVGDVHMPCLRLADAERNPARQEPSRHMMCRARDPPRATATTGNDEHMDNDGPPQRPLEDSILEAAARHVCYEVEQVALGTHRTAPARTYEASGNLLVEDGHLHNVILEAFLVHVRVLDDFLGKRQPREEDVLAIDYCPEYEPALALDSEDRLDIDRRVAHLTLRRTDDFQWGGRERLQRDVFRQFRAFLASLREHHPERAEWFDPRFHEARKFVRETWNGWPDRFR